MEFSRSIFEHCAVLVQPCDAVDLICLGTEETAWMRQDCSPGKNGSSVWAFELVNADITCIQTHQCAVWCFLTGSVWGSCTCLVLPSCSLHGWRHSLFSWSRPEHWPTLSLKPGNHRIKTTHTLLWHAVLPLNVQNIWQIILMLYMRYNRRLTSRCFCKRSFFSASVIRSSSLRSLYVAAEVNSALASALLSSFSSCSFSALRGSWMWAAITLFLSSSLVFSRSSCTMVAWQNRQR